jgi:3,4-dihydroxy 2-butanone 4-phosphate synthase
MAQLICDCSGNACLCLDAEHVARVGLWRMFERDESRHGTLLTFSIEAREGISTPMSAADRVTTVRVACGRGARRAAGGLCAAVRPGAAQRRGCRAGSQAIA